MAIKKFVAVIAMLLLPIVARAMPAPDAVSVLILEPTVGSPCVGSLEYTKALGQGLTPVCVDALTWGAMTTADFASYKAIVLGDPICVGGTGPIAAAEANKAVWGPAIMGNVVVIGTDPAYHAGGVPGAAVLTDKGIAFAAAEPGKTGAYITLSCYYYSAASGTPVPVLDPFGSFSVVGQGGCPAFSHIIAVHPALSGLTDADLSSWSCSTHEGFVTWSSTFLVLAISEDVPSLFVAPDGTTGAPYIVARGSTLSPILCGNGVLNSTEECDDGNTTNGDGCNAQCKKEFCGDGIVNDNLVPGTEQCDDGNNVSGDGCSATCKIEPKGPVCGNGILESGEECDDGNLLNGDGCNSLCKKEFCGDGVLQPGLGEKCDDGNTVNTDACKNDCTPNVCGDGVVYTGVEECDDGSNGNNGDGCTDNCLINFSPDCSKASADPMMLWPPDHKMVSIGINGVTDPDADPVTITATSVWQDEQVSKVTGDGAGSTSPDAQLSPLMVRAERNGNPKTPGDGRVYHVSFTADDGMGGSCTGNVLVCVPHDQGQHSTCVDEGSLYNSLLP